MKTADYTTMGDVIRYQARRRPEHPALIFDGTVASYAELDDRSERLAGALAALGVKPGERIAILARNSDRYLVCLFATSKLGAVFTPVNWRLGPAEVEFVLTDCEARYVFVDEDFLPVVTQAALRDRITPILLDSETPGHASYRRLLDSSPPLAPGQVPTEHTAGDVALQMYTSGTTGLPKGAMLTNANLGKLCDLDGPPTPPHFRVSPEDVILVLVPLFHIGGIEVSLRPLFYGATLVIHRLFDPELTLIDIERYRVTNTSLVPTALQLIIEHPRAASTDFGSLAIIYYGAAPIPSQLVRDSMALMGCDFAQSYGMTEATGTFCSLPPEDHSPDGTPRMRSAGKALPGVELKIVDRHGRSLGPRQSGEIAVRARSVMLGYWKKPEANAIDPDGWLSTGDVGYLDEDGYVYIQDRLKDMIISGAENISSAEVENVLFEHPDIAEVAVIGVPDPKWGEAVKAVVVARPGLSPDPADIIAWARSRIASYKLPRSIDIVDSLPHNATGKVMKPELRKRYGVAGGPAA